VDDGNVGLSMVLAPGTSPQRTNETALRLEATVRKCPTCGTSSRRPGSFFGSGTAERPGRGNLDVQLARATDGPTCRRCGGSL
jgi:hypothetical protein